MTGPRRLGIALHCLACAVLPGLPTAQDGIHPYVMSSGTWWSHVMIMERPLRY